MAAASADVQQSTTQQDRAQYEARWEAHWTADGGLQKGQMWDVGASAPSLVKLLTDQKELVEGKRALVPGCGRGYDVVTLAQRGAAMVVGLELAPAAVASAQEEVRAQLAAGTLTEAQASEVVELAQGNFFEWQHQGGGFDLGYDYTFGCAMHPSMRKDWAANWARLLRRADGSGGRLVTLVFPCDPDRPALDGPPFPVSPELYRELLEPAGFRLDHLAPVPHELSIPKRQGREFLALWTLT